MWSLVSILHIGPVAHFVDVGVTRNVKGCQKLQSGWPTHFVDQHICWCGWCSVTVQFVVSGLLIDTICWSGDVFRINILRKRPILLVHFRDGRPAPRGTLPAGKGGFPAPSRAVGKGGFPTPPRPIKMIKMAGKLRGKINAPISTFSNRGNQWWNNITTLNNAQSSLSMGYARES